MEEIDLARSRIRSPFSRQRRRDKVHGLRLAPQSPKESRPSSRTITMGLASAKEYEEELDAFTRSKYVRKHTIWKLFDLDLL